MPVKWEVDPETGIGVVHVEGEATLEEGIEALRGLWASPDYRFRLLLDAREHAGSVEASVWHQLSALTDRERPEASGGRTVYLVSRDVDFGMSRMAQALYAEPPIGFLVTRSYDEAIAFLMEEDGARE